MKYVVGYRWDGLGSRLIMLANVMRVAGVLEREWKFIWPWHVKVGASDYPTELFQRDFLKKHCTDMKWLLSNPHFVSISNCLESTITSSMTNSDALIMHTSSVALLEGELLASIREDLRNAFTLIPFAPGARVASEKYGSREFDLGIHVRRGDVVGHSLASELSRLIDLDFYFRLIDIIEPSSFYVCCEDEEVIRDFKDRYGDACHYVENMPVDRSKNDVLLHHLSDIIVLSNSRLLISSRSAFSRCAELIGNRPNIVLQYKDNQKSDPADYRHICIRLVEAGFLEAAGRVVDQMPLKFNNEADRNYISRRIAAAVKLKV